MSNSPSFEEMYAFLKSAYKPDRFEGRNCPYDPEHSLNKAKDRIQLLEERGYFTISKHESITGVGRFIGRDLKDKPKGWKPSHEQPNTEINEFGQHQIVFN